MVGHVVWACGHVTWGDDVVKLSEPILGGRARARVRGAAIPYLQQPEQLIGGRLRRGEDPAQLLLVDEQAEARLLLHAALEGELCQRAERLPRRRGLGGKVGEDTVVRNRSENLLRRRRKRGRGRRNQGIRQ